MSLYIPTFSIPCCSAHYRLSVMPHCLPPYFVNPSLHFSASPPLCFSQRLLKTETDGAGAFEKCIHSWDDHLCYLSNQLVWLIKDFNNLCEMVIILIIVLLWYMVTSQYVIASSPPPNSCTVLPLSSIKVIT